MSWLFSQALEEEYSAGTGTIRRAGCRVLFPVGCSRRTA